MLKVGYEIRELLPDDLLDHGQGMFGRAYAGAGFGSSEDLCLDVPLLRHIAMIGHLLALGLFYGEELVGYCALGISPDLRHRGRTQAQLISIFIAPEHRGQSMSEQLVDAAEQLALDRGVDSLVMFAKRGSVFLSVLERLFCDDRQEVAFVRTLR